MTCQAKQNRSLSLKENEYGKMPQTISPSATLTHSELSIHFCRPYKFRGGSTSPTSSANSAQLGAETASLQLPRSCSLVLKRGKLLFCHCEIFLTQGEPMLKQGLVNVGIDGIYCQCQKPCGCRVAAISAPRSSELSQKMSLFGSAAATPGTEFALGEQRGGACSASQISPIIFIKERLQQGLLLS